MRTSRPRPIAINSLNDLLSSFLTDVPPQYSFQATRLQIYPIAYFLPYLRVPTPLNVAPFSYLILQSRGSGVVQVNAEVLSLRSRGAMFVHRGSVVSLRSLHRSTTGWMIMYDDAVLTRALQPRTIERVLGLRSPVPFSRDTLAWMEHLCTLLATQIRTEAAAGRAAEDQPVCDHLFGALIERLLAEAGTAAPKRVERSDSLEARFRRLVFKHATTEGTVGFYAGMLNVSENYLLRCVRNGSGRSPKDWIIDVRLMEARRLLRTTDATIAEIAAGTGFEDASYFGRLFRRRFGMSPRDFRTIPEQDLS